VTASRRATAILLCAAAGLTQAGALAAAPHDGSWAIEVVTERGNCERLYRYYVVVDGEAIHLRSSFGETSEAPVGALRKDGRIDVTLGQTDDLVSVKGQLGAASGGGNWSAPARNCAGRWSASKRA
jgi:hypothetical protein